MNRRNTLVVVLFAALLMLALSSYAVFAAGDRAAAAVNDVSDGGVKVLKFDMAENGHRYSQDETPVHDDGTAAYGAEFITEGYLYPAGTLACEDNVCNGVNEDGSPEFPDKVIGTWTCYGDHVGDGAHTVTGPIVITTQLYDLGETPGAQSIVTNGFELVDLETPVARAILGGTGRYREARGEQIQTLLGLNNPEGVFGVVLRIELKVQQ